MTASPAARDRTARIGRDNPRPMDLIAYALDFVLHVDDQHRRPGPESDALAEALPPQAVRLEQEVTRPALPVCSSECSSLPTSPMVA